MKQFIEDHFDKILLGAMLMYLVHVVIFLSLRTTAPEVISWARELTSGFAGGLLGLITGMRIQNGGTTHADKPGNSNPAVNDQKPKE